MSLFITSDQHWGHAKCITFVQPDGSPLRPFSSIEEMNETLVSRWNEVVDKGDTTYCLGDVAFTKEGLRHLGRCNGRKILFAGNHDRFKLKDYAEYFDDIRGCYYRDGLVYSHIPVHPDNLQGHYKGNVHGHLHCHQVIKDGKVDPRFFNACVEQHNFHPVPWEEIKEYFAGNSGGTSDLQHATA